MGLPYQTLWILSIIIFVHKGKIRLYNIKYYIDHVDEILKRNKIYVQEYSKRDYVKIKRTVSNRIYGSLKRQSASKRHHTIEYLGCSWEFYKDYIEKQFTPGMTWENYGQFGWHIDHIKPLYTFNLCNDEECFKAFHYSNTRPLWWRDNLGRPKQYIRRLF